MGSLDLARWQFAATTIYHFWFVPLSIGLVFLVAGMQTAWVRTGDEKWLRLTRFFGKLFLINFAIGVVTGIVQEFQFGMNWSSYSRFVGDVFGAPLAIEGLLAFFMEATFIGLWMFGWNRLPRRVHLATIWTVAVGTLLSSYFILAANSWMQHPVGYTIDAGTGRPRLTDIVAVLTNDVTLAAMFHTTAACFLVGGALVTGVSLWRYIAAARTGTADAGDATAFRSATKTGAWTSLGASAALVLSGDLISRVMFAHQPMKMAAGEGLTHTEAPAAMSLLHIGPIDVRVPNLLSLLATHSLDGRVQGMSELQAAAQARYGPGSYAPLVPVTYASYRLMIAAGLAAGLIATIVLWRTRGGRAPRARWLRALAVVTPLLPLAACTAGWVFTEVGRQPWVVSGLLRTSDGVSPGVGTIEVAISLGVFVVLYAVLAVVECRLFLRYARGPLPAADPPAARPDTLPAFAY